MRRRSVYFFVACVFGVIAFAVCWKIWAPLGPVVNGGTGPKIDDLLCNPDVTLPLLMETQVREELKLNPEQAEQLHAINREFTGGASFMDVELQRKVTDRIQAVLLPNQAERLNQICIQLDQLYFSLLAHPNVQAVLELSEEQKTSLIHVREEEASRATALFATSKPKEIPEAKRTLLKEMSLKKLAVLTESQRERYDTMKGAPVKLDNSGSFGASK